MKKKDIKEALSINARKAANARWKKTTKKQRKEVSKKMHEARYGTGDKLPMQADNGKLI